MAAPSTAYLDGGATTLPIKNGSVTDELLLALHLAEYGTVAQFQQLFHVGIVLAVKKGNVEGIIASVYDHAEEPAYKLHAPARRSKLCIEINGNSFRLLNDGGLNTYGPIATGNPLRLSFPLALEIVASANYYTASSDYGFEVSVNGGAFFPVSFGFLTAGGTDQSTKAIPGVYSYGMVIQWRAYNTNPEGTNYSPYVSARIRPENYRFTVLTSDNGSTRTFTAYLYGNDYQTPITLEVDLVITVRQDYQGNFPSSYVNVTIPAGQTSGSNTLAMSSASIGFIEQTHSPFQTSDSVPITYFAAIFWKVRLVRSVDPGGTIEYSFAVFQNDGTTPATFTVDVVFNVRQFFTDMEGSTGYADAPAVTLYAGEQSTMTAIQDINLEMEPGSTLQNFEASANPNPVDGKTIIFIN